MDLWAVLTCWLIGVAFYAIYLPCLMGMARITRRVPPTPLLTLVRWLIMPALIVVVTRFGLGWEGHQILVSVLAYYVSGLLRQRKVQLGKRPTDRETLQALFVAAHSEEIADRTPVELGEEFDPDSVFRRRTRQGNDEDGS